ncbi:MAG: Eco57I restriction-modification methylase domain-containing protein [Deltaproteobacteria bacterium]|nr:Eco57I restriction-modification methylase domain-containing protein [Deltaproteobacteria bacterium]
MKRLGVVYTPPDVAAPMVRVALEPLLRGRSADELCALRVCDFSVGEGAFVACIIEQLAAAIRTAWAAEGTRGTEALSSTLAARCVAGVDVDAHAVEIARDATGCRDLRVADALTLDWPAAFPDVFARGGFDAIVGNPPYVRQEWLAGKRALDGFAVGNGVADLYVYFIELAHRILRPGGRYCVITPNKWLTVEYARALREFLVAARSVEGVVDLARLPLFEDADAFPCITWGTVGRRTQPRGHRATAGDVDSALRDPGVVLEITANPWHIDAPATRALIERLERSWPALGAVLPERPARGVVTGCNRAFVIDRETRERLLVEDPANASLIRPFVKGRDLRRWRTAEIDRFILLVGRGTSLANHPAIESHLARFRDALEPKPAEHRGAWGGRKPGAYRWFELQDPVGELAASTAPRLLYQDIQTGPACALDRRGLVPDTTVWILPSADRVLLAILNSSLYGWYARQRFPPALNGSVRPKLAYMRALPIATADERARRRIEGLVDNQLAGRDVERELDEEVCRLYQLTAGERAVVNRPAEV